MSECPSGKQRFRNRFEAEQFISTTVRMKRAARRKHIEPLTSYKCPLCGGHHITSSLENKHKNR